MTELSDSARALAEALAGDTPAAARLRAAFGRMTLWRWATGRRTPRADAAARLQSLCRAVRVTGWTRRTEADRAA